VNLGGCLGPLGAEVGGEHVGRGWGVVLVLGVPDLGERFLRARLGDLGSAFGFDKPERPTSMALVRI